MGAHDDFVADERIDVPVCQRLHCAVKRRRQYDFAAGIGTMRGPGVSVAVQQGNPFAFE